MNYIKDVKKVVVKVGSSSLTHNTGLLNLSAIDHLVRDLSNIHNRGIEVVLVSSGAISAGMGRLGFAEKPHTIPEKQACAAVGQVRLIHTYDKLFAEYGNISSQILFNRDDMSDRVRFLNARNTFFSLLKLGVIPIVNENDALTVDEIKFGDNDTLSAMVSSLIEADLLIILSDIDGLYDSNPKDNPDAKLIKVVNEINEDIEKMAGGAGSSIGTGGMATKIKAGKIATTSGTSMIIANSNERNVITRIFDGEEIGTYFKASSKPMHSKKHWLAYETKTQGEIIIDDGAVIALKNHNSLLPKGILDVTGNFVEGDVVSILSTSKDKIANGIVNYSSNEILLIKGNDSSEINKLLGYKNFDEIIHINNMVLL